MQYIYSCVMKLSKRIYAQFVHHLILNITEFLIKRIKVANIRYDDLRFLSFCCSMICAKVIPLMCVLRFIFTAWKKTYFSSIVSSVIKS